MKKDYTKLTNFEKSLAIKQETFNESLSTDRKLYHNFTMLETREFMSNMTDYHDLHSILS